MEYIGIDLGKTSSQLCILTADGELIERRVKTSREQFDTWLGRRAPARILIEATTESEWVARHLEGMGHEVIVADPNFAPMYATRSRRVKTDKRDARALCEACRLGSYRRAHRTSEAQRQVKRLLVVREALARTRAKYVTTIKALVRAEGLRAPASEARRSTERLAAPPLPEHLSAVISPLVALLTELNRQIAEAAGRLEEVAEHDPVVERLRTAPGVGVVTAVTFVPRWTGPGGSRRRSRCAATWGWCRARRVRASGSGGGGSRRPATGGCGRCWWRPAGACCARNRPGRRPSGTGPRSWPGGGARAWRPSPWRASWRASSSRCGGTGRPSGAGMRPEGRMQCRPRE
jgi:transposase